MKRSPTKTRRERRAERRDELAPLDARSLAAYADHLRQILASPPDDLTTLVPTERAALAIHQRYPEAEVEAITDGALAVGSILRENPSLTPEEAVEALATLGVSEAGQLLLSHHPRLWREKLRVFGGVGPAGAR